MKRIIFIITILTSAILLSFSSVAAADDYDATIKVDYSYDEESSVMTVTASVCDIKDPKGLALIEYDIKYDGDVLELQSSNVNMPDAWKQFVDSGMAEDLSHKRKNEDCFRWSMGIISNGYGVTKDGELMVTLEFKILEKKDTQVEFVCINLGNDDLDEVRGNSAVVTLTMGDDETPNIEVSEDVSIPVETSSNPNGNVHGTSDPINASDVNNDVSDLSSSETSVEEDNTTLNVVIAVFAAVGIAVIVGLVIVLVRKANK